MGNTSFKDEWFEKGEVAALEQWLAKNSSNWQNEYGNTVTHWACWHRQPAMLQVIKDNGGDLNVPNKGANTPLILGAFRKSTDCVKLMIEWKADCNAVNSQGQTALDVAVLNGHEDVAELLRPVTTVQPRPVQRPVIEPSRQATIPEDGEHPDDDKNNEHKSKSPTSGSNVDLQRTPSFASRSRKKKQKPWKDRWFERGKVKSVERWVRKYDPNWQNEFGNTAAHWACWHHSRSILELLAVSNAGLEITNKGLNTPLHLAAYRGAKDCVQYLLSRKVETDILNNQGQSAFDVATKLGHIEIADAILKASEENLRNLQQTPNLNKAKIEELVNQHAGPTLNTVAQEKPVDLKQIASLYLSLDLENKGGADDDDLSEASELSTDSEYSETSTH